VVVPSVIPPRITAPKVVAPKVVAPLPVVAPREADEPDGFDVWFDEPNEAAPDDGEDGEADSMPDILDVWLDKPDGVPSEVGAASSEESGARFMAYAHALPFPLYSAPFERVELGELPATARAWPDDATDVLVPRRSTATRVFLTAGVLALALALGLGLAVLVLRAST
ncbi:MAG TPA: hypothetical protein VFQ65_06915, partial [Kofleriaceae bacterium]|nr:hypothetical protein [Kofleriaceae bacterium]